MDKCPTCGSPKQLMDSRATRIFYECWSFCENGEHHESRDCIANQLVQAQVTIAEQDTEIKRLNKRDGNATIELCYKDGINPFAREDLEVVDVGVSDNCYVVESKVLEDLQAQIVSLEQCIDDHDENFHLLTELIEVDWPLNEKERAFVDEMKGKKPPYSYDDVEWMHKIYGNHCG